MTLLEAPVTQDLNTVLPKPGSKAEKVVEVLNLHPDWPDKQVAEEAGCDQSYILRVKRDFLPHVPVGMSVPTKTVPKYGDKKKKILEYAKKHPEALGPDIARAVGCSPTHAQRIVRTNLGKKKTTATKTGKFPRKHSGRKNPLDNVLEIDAHRSAARMEGKFMAIETILSKGLADIGKTIDSIDKMPENRQRLKELLRGALAIAESMEPPAEEQNTQREGHASVNAQVQLTKIK